MKEYNNYLMKEHSNMKIGGIAKKFIEIENKEEILQVLKENKDIFILGNGTNTLINDGELETVFVSLKKIDYIKKIDECIVEVGVGTDFSALTEFMEKEDYTGLENLAGIPGSVGGLVFMNGGAHGTEIFDRIIEVEIVDENNEIRKIKKEDLNFSYRSTEIKLKKWIVLSATFKFEKGYKKDVVEGYKKKREENHPLTEPNLGSTFKNPEGYFSARLIIEAGMQGKRIGGAEVSMVHPNFIVNKGDATFKDVISLINLVKKEVKNKTGIELHEEIIVVEK